MILDVAALSIDDFIARWGEREGGAERANYALFLSELCDVIGVRRPEPAASTTELNDYVFERSVSIKELDGTTTQGRIDLYKRGSFVLEAKQSRMPGGKKALPTRARADLLEGASADRTKPRRLRSSLPTRGGWDALMLNARRQAHDYARALPSAHGWPPFLIACDVGYCLEIFSDFNGLGKNYEQFPDRQGFRIYLEDLRSPEIRARLKAIWEEPLSLDPARRRAKATREIVQRLAEVSKALEEQNLSSEDVAQFLMRFLFTMFAEDVKLLPENALKDLLARCKSKPETFKPMIEQLWEAMDKGDFAYGIQTKVLRFNGNLFRGAKAFVLGPKAIGELQAAASKSWRDVEPAIFGALLEQALDPNERRRLGAHYTPSAYVERLVVATAIEPLRQDWAQAQGLAEIALDQGDRKGAAAVVAAFHETLRKTRVLDPACGTGNFLYVALRLIKTLEDEVLESLAALGGQEALRSLEGHTVDPETFLGLEANPRAAAIAELVLWLGYLQIHFKSNKGEAPAEPILKAFKNINFGKPRYDAVLAHDGEDLTRETDGQGKVVEVRRYRNPRRPAWPEAEFIVGNPPFMGGKDVRGRQGESYAKALWAAHPHMNESADFVMYWWDRAAELLTAQSWAGGLKPAARKKTPLRRFGFVTTNSITQEFSRRTIRKRLEGKKPISLIMAIPDHPWTRVTRDAAAVRIAMTVAEAGKQGGVLMEAIREEKIDTNEPDVTFRHSEGRINPDLTVGVDVTEVIPLKSNDGQLSCPGVKLHGAGFIVTPQKAADLGLGRRVGLEKHIRPYRNGRDLMGRSRNLMAIDFEGLSDAQIRKKFPEAYQHLLEFVKPERVVNRRATYRLNWWIFGEPRRELRPALVGLKRYIATVETAKHRVFQFLDAEILPDNKLIAIAVDDAHVLGVLSSRIHTIWAFRAGGWLGVGNDSVYAKSKVFDPFPFPDASISLRQNICQVGEEIDALRKARQIEHPNLTLTNMYNTLEKIKSGAPLTAEEKLIKSEGLILILKELHENLDRLVFQAYGWPETLSDEEILTRLVALNKKRAWEEARGHVRWLRPDYQTKRLGEAAPKPQQAEADFAAASKPTPKPSFPSALHDQSAALMDVLMRSSAPLDALSIAMGFKQGKKILIKVEAILSALARVGVISPVQDGKSFRLRRLE